MDVVHHFSEDDRITSFTPHVPRTNPTQAPAVWAIDAEHAPLYWFPRDCPRVTAWPRDAAERTAFERSFFTTARRVHYVEYAWLAAMRTTTLFRYDFDARHFSPWPEASGQWIASEPVEPEAVAPVGDLFERHREARIELRVVDSVLPAADIVNDDRWDFSIVRLDNSGRMPAT